MPMGTDRLDFLFQDNRKKVDLQNMEKATDILQHREKGSSDSGFVFDFRKSLAWDSAFFDSPGILDPEELCETLNIQLVDNRSHVIRMGDSESRESATANRISNLRKSLAWDNAFFTSAGVLDAGELSIVNRGFKRPDMIRFPEAKEEIWHSPESNSRVNADGYSLASLEIDLFDDIRSSNSNASLNVATPTGKLEKKKGQLDDRASKKLNGSSHIQHGAPHGESSSSSRKPPKISSHVNASRILPSKRPILVNKATKSASGKKMCLRESCNVLSTSMSSLKSPASVLPAARNDHPRSPSNRRRRIDSHMAASVSNFKTPSKYSIKNKTEVVNSSDTTRLFSTPNSSPFTSPDSSMDTSSSEQSLTSIKQKSNTSKISQETKFLNPQINVSMSSSQPISVSRKLTPSGLRMPSPKLGYFDAEKSVGLAQNAGMKFNSEVLGSCPKTGSGIRNANGTANVTRYGRNRSLTGCVSKSGKICSKQHGNVKANNIGEHNKENVSVENNVRWLTQSMGAMNFSTDVSKPRQWK